MPLAIDTVSWYSEPTASWSLLTPLAPREEAGINVIHAVLLPSCWPDGPPCNMLNRLTDYDKLPSFQTLGPRSRFVVGLTISCSKYQRAARSEVLHGGISSDLGGPWSLFDGGDCPAFEGPVSILVEHGTKQKSLDVVYIYTHPHIPTKQYGNHIMEQIHFRFLHELNMARRCQSFLNRHLGKMASGPNHGMVCPSKHIEEGCIGAYIELALQALAADRLMWPARPKWHALWLFDILKNLLHCLMAI
jgi:hypothetical protein